MKKILVILDGIVAKKLLNRIIESNVNDNSYDIIYINDVILGEHRPSNFTFYKFDPTSKSKISMVLDKDIHTEVLIALNSKDEMLNVIKNIKDSKSTLHMSVLDYWGLEIDDPYVNVHQGIDVLANGMVERLPNIPILAQNIGLKQGEIMEIRIPFGSAYAFRYVGSIEQKDWKIFALYRNEELVTIKPSLILKPNDTILIIGKPKVLMQVYKAVGRTQGQFPRPFGTNIYLYLDLYLQSEKEIVLAIKEAIYLNKRLKNKKLIIKITRPTNVGIMNQIKELVKSFEKTVIIDMDYANSTFSKIMKSDIKKYDIGVLMLTHKLFFIPNYLNELEEIKIPIFKIGLNEIASTKETFVLLNDTKSYEQISPIVFDISAQLSTKTKIFDMDPIGFDDKEDKKRLLEHFENLAKIFNQRIEIQSKDANPIQKLKEQKNILQIMPFKKEMLKKRYFFDFFYTNSDLISFDMEHFNQILIPIVEDEEE